MCNNDAVFYACYIYSHSTLKFVISIASCIFMIMSYYIILEYLDNIGFVRYLTLLESVTQIWRRCEALGSNSMIS